MADYRAKAAQFAQHAQAVLADYAARLDRIRAIHAPSPDGSCRECVKPFPCPTASASVGGPSPPAP